MTSDTKGSRLSFVSRSFASMFFMSTLGVNCYATSLSPAMASRELSLGALSLREPIHDFSSFAAIDHLPVSLLHLLDCRFSDMQAFWLCSMSALGNYPFSSWSS